MTVLMVVCFLVSYRSDFSVPKSPYLYHCQQCAMCSSLTLINGSLQTYHGGIQLLRSASDRERAAADVVARARAVVRHLQQHGVDCPVVTGGGTGTVLVDAASGVLTEVQPGKGDRGDLHIIVVRLWTSVP